MVGETLSHYRILAELGRGGMGVVYKALDLKLNREVALKVLRPDLLADDARKQRFVQEARAAAALSHPGIAVVYEIDEADGESFIAMELVDGRPLRDAIDELRRSPERVLALARSILEALTAAHDKHIVHRDLKPENLMVTGGGVKVLDFGLAKLLEHDSGSDELTSGTTQLRTRAGTIVGTASYMSPEQAEGEPVDVRSDVFSFGVVLYEMLTGRRPFRGDSFAAVQASILRDEPRFEPTDAGIPAGLRKLVMKCLAKAKDDRYRSARDALADLDAVSAAGTRGAHRGRVLAGLGALALVLIALVALGVSWRSRDQRAAWARDVATPEIARLTEAGDFAGAFMLAQEALAILPEDRALQQMRDTVAARPKVTSEPSGAHVYWKNYLRPESEWNELGVTPVEGELVPAAYLRWRVVKEGYPERYVGGAGFMDLSITLHPETEPDDGMVHVPAGVSELASGNTLELGGFWIDRHEVTNAAYQAFVDAGGYERDEFWKHAFRDGATELAWEEAMRRFTDRTGRAGPSTWELGAFPAGEDDYPVQGVSWYEAAAYAEFVGKSLPTVYHWRHAALGSVLAAMSSTLANFGGAGAIAVGSSDAMDPFGSFDLGGNVKEWCLNASGDNRFILGGSWEDPPYMFSTDFESHSPFERLPTHGFRTIRLDEPTTRAMVAPIEMVQRDYSREVPVSDELFSVFKNLYAYDRTPLDDAVESLPPESISDHMRGERITVNAAYGNERLPLHFYVPIEVAPPFQTVVMFPASDSLHVDGFAFYEPYIEFLVRSGRAVALPFYKGTFGRRVDIQSLGANEQRELLVQMYKDLGRSLDYLETRDDVDRSRLAFFGVSLGARFGPLFDAVDDRFAALVLVAGGLYQGGEFYTVRPVTPEVDPFHFAPRSTSPTLMVNGRNDFIRPVDTHQTPLFELLGVNADDRRHALFDSGHIPPRLDTIRETLDWLDRYLGPVGSSAER